MGHGGYDSHSRGIRSASLYAGRSSQEIFSSNLNNAMNPKGAQLRECRDNADHPETQAIVLALDVTGSMGSIPEHLVKEGLPVIMEEIIKGGQKDAALLFLGIGDHEWDQAPLQVGQFESSDELLDKWLTTLWIEGNGGGNTGESYLLAWYFAAKHTSIDCFEKRKKKGFLFTIGDEPTLKNIPARALKGIMGDGQYDDFTSVKLLDMAREKYEVYHLHLMQGHNGRNQSVMDGWKQLMGDNLIIINDQKDVVSKVVEIVTKGQEAKPEENNDIQQAPEADAPVSADVIEEML